MMVKRYVVYQHNGICYTGITVTLTIYGSGIYLLIYYFSRKTRYLEYLSMNTIFCASTADKL